MRAPSPRLLPRFAWWFCEDASSRRFMFIATPPSAYSIPISYGGQMDALDALEMQRKDVPGTLSSTTQIALDTELLETVLTSSGENKDLIKQVFNCGPPVLPEPGYVILQPVAAGRMFPCILPCAPLFSSVVVDKPSEHMRFHSARRVKSTVVFNYRKKSSSLHANGSRVTPANKTTSSCVSSLPDATTSSGRHRRSKLRGSHLVNVLAVPPCDMSVVCPRAYVSQQRRLMSGSIGTPGYAPSSRIPCSTEVTVLSSTHEDVWDVPSCTLQTNLFSASEEQHRSTAHRWSWRSTSVFISTHDGLASGNLGDCKLKASLFA
ncbi:hypothetical protein A0H81_12173 [Grifola frondosa]|uniref:Uncharacterized protein n=1 Tax=Grifola frondosa TaxID=5627 RepID=A0A1C7LUT5_GRIFR|nr:hypothetical protein A0H81_12173 [Grifola frondosa]